MEDVLAGVREMDWKKLLGSTTASVDEEIRLRNAYLVAENRIFRQQITGRVQLTDGDRQALAELGQQLGKQALAEIATLAKPDTILAWHRTCADQQGNRSQPHKSIGRPRIDKAIEDLVVRMARENRSWGYDRIVGAVKNLGYAISDQTVGNILKRHGIPPAPARKKTVTWREFIRCHLDVLLATDFFTGAVWSCFGLVISFLLCVIHCSRCQVYTAGTTLSQHMQWILSSLSRSLDVHVLVQRWIWLVQAPVRLRQLLSTAVVLGHTVSPCASFDDRKAQSQARGRVVLLCTAYPGQIRDGPMRHRYGPSGLLKDDYREAA